MNTLPENNPPEQGRYELSSKAVFPLKMDSEGKRVYDLVQAAKIETKLAQFSGTENYYQHGKYLFTDGIFAMAELCNAVWLLLSVFLFQTEETVQHEEFQVWKLRPHDTGYGATLRCEDGNGNSVFSKEFEQTSFPLPNGIDLFFSNGVLYLPSEH
jgi:hypothetical protein